MGKHLKNLMCFLVAAVLLLGADLPAKAGTVYVDAAAMGANNGSSWIDAYTDLQSALVPAASGTSIWVAAGTYKPTPGSSRTVTFQLKNGVALYGGFSGTEATLSQRNLASNATILSGDIGVVGVSTDNSYHVVTGSGTNSTAVLDGFLVTAGVADGAADDGSGGGMLIMSGSPTVMNVSFAGNSASTFGGGIYNSTGSSPFVVNVVFWQNSAAWGGGMLNLGDSNATLLNGTFSENSAVNRGGGMCNLSSTPTVINTILWGDLATGGGNEIYNTTNTPVISYSLIEGSGGSGAGWDGSLGTDGGHNIDADPSFANQAGSNLRLTLCSPSVDTGNNAALNLPATDCDGYPRIVRETVDMGAYEFQGGPVIYVNQNALGAATGLSWVDAFRDLQDALNFARSGACPVNEIWVAAGTYKPTTGSDRTVMFDLVDGVALYGGFAGTETDRSQRDWVNNVAILSGDIGALGINTDNSYIVVGASTGPTGVLDGFTVTGAFWGGGPGGPTGGMVIGSTTITNVIFSGNTSGRGGGLYIMWLSNPTLSNLVFSENSAGSGGGVYNEGNPTLTNVVFSQNSATGSGGGMYNEGSATLTNVVFEGNTTPNWGGGMYNGGNSVLTNVVFEENTGSAGGGIVSMGQSLTLVNATFSRNVGGDGGGVCMVVGTCALTNTVMWGDAAVVGNEICNVASTLVISYSLIEGSGGSGARWDGSLGTDGGHNVDADPRFVDSENGNLRIRSALAINAGNNAAVPTGVTTDLDRNPRIVGGTVDMGAYEVQDLTGIEPSYAPEPFRIVSVSPNPFNPTTTIRFTLPAAMPVAAGVWSVAGTRVRVLANQKQFGPGDNQILWDGRNDQGSPVASGVYFVRIETRLGAKVTRAVLLK